MALYRSCLLLIVRGKNRLAAGALSPSAYPLSHSQMQTTPRACTKLSEIRQHIRYRVVRRGLHATGYTALDCATGREKHVCCFGHSCSESVGLLGVHRQLGGAIAGTADNQTRLSEFRFAEQDTPFHRGWWYEGKSVKRIVTSDSGLCAR